MKRIHPADTPRRLAAIRAVLKKRNAHPEDDDEALLMMIVDGKRAIDSRDPFPEPEPVRRKS